MPFLLVRRGATMHVMTETRTPIRCSTMVTVAEEATERELVRCEVTRCEKEGSEAV